MRFLLIASGRRDFTKIWHVQQTSRAGTFLPPYDLACIAATIRSQRHQANVLDLRLHRDQLSTYLDMLDEWRPDCVILNLATASCEFDYMLLEATPRPIMRVCFGTHALLMREEAFGRGVDAILHGDPEVAIAHWIRRGGNLDSCAGVITRERNSTPVYADTTDDLPTGAAAIVGIMRYRSSLGDGRWCAVPLLSSRGSPTFQRNSLCDALFGASLRMRSIESIRTEIDELQGRSNVAAVQFMDPALNCSADRVAYLSTMLLGRPKGLRWSCNLSTVGLSEVELRLMKQAGCRLVFFETKCADMLDESRPEFAALREAVSHARNAGIRSVLTVELRDLNELVEGAALSRLKMIRPDMARVSAGIPLPSKSLFDYALQGQEERSYWTRFDPFGHWSPDNRTLEMTRAARRIERAYQREKPVGLIGCAGIAGARVAIRSGLSYVANAVKAARFVRERESFARSNQRLLKDGILQESNVMDSNGAIAPQTKLSDGGSTCNKDSTRTKLVKLQVRIDRQQPVAS